MLNPDYAVNLLYQIVICQYLKAIKSGKFSYLVYYTSGNFICSAVWVAYGFCTQDEYILAPNFLGALVGCVQISLLIRYSPASIRDLKLNSLEKLFKGKWGDKDRKTSYGSERNHTLASKVPNYNVRYLDTGIHDEFEKAHQHGI